MSVLGDVLAIVYLVWILSIFIGFTIMDDVIDYYLGTEYESKSCVIFFIVPIVFVVKFRKNIIPKIIRGTKTVFSAIINIVKIIAFKKGE